MRVVLFLIVSSTLSQPVQGVPIERLFKALKSVETGSLTKSFPIGDQGRSRGPFQIMRGYWKESGVPGSYEMVDDPHYARKVMIGYWKRYCPKALASGDFETLARVHNGGPKGMKKKATLGYWKRVKHELDLSVK